LRFGPGPDQSNLGQENRATTYRYYNINKKRQEDHFSSFIIIILSSIFSTCYLKVGLTYDSFGPTINGYEYCLYWWSHWYISVMPHHIYIYELCEIANQNIMKH